MFAASPFALFVSLPLANGEGFWVLIGLCFAVWGILAAIGKTAEGHRKHAATTDRKRCHSCRAEHPGFANFCRHCGRRF